jgi:hypothetical protein
VDADILVVKIGMEVDVASALRKFSLASRLAWSLSHATVIAKVALNHLEQA